MQHACSFKVDAGTSAAVVYPSNVVVLRTLPRAIIGRMSNVPDVREDCTTFCVKSFSLETDRDVALIRLVSL